MSASPVRCKHCKSAIVAMSRPGSADAKRLRAVDDLAYGQPSERPGWVRVQCPSCRGYTDIRGRLVIEAA